MIIRCDGCRYEVPSTSMKFVQAEGRECRYCDSCHEQYQSFVLACLAKERDLNRLLDLFIEETRKRVPLKLMPQDLPRSDALMRLA